jgi:ribosomal protein S18 acetylase RimI-like enzyme
LGLGRQLVCKVANEFIQRGITSMLLFGDANNPSNKFYEKIGAQKLFAKNGEFHGGHGWTDLEKFVAPHLICTLSFFRQLTSSVLV